MELWVQTTTNNHTGETARMKAIITNMLTANRAKALVLTYTFNNCTALLREFTCSPCLRLLRANKSVGKQVLGGNKKNYSDLPDHSQPSIIPAASPASKTNHSLVHS